MKNIGNILKQAQEMQAKMAKIQEDLGNAVLTGSAGGGMVEVTMNGKQEVVKVRLDHTVVDANDIEMLEDLITSAFNDAQRRIQQMAQEQLSKVTGGLNIPGLNLPF
ncbi:MAG: YbaB/EbfC family nucleoid-associated protein [Magnetococcus sp. DMHC-6]